MKEIHQVPMLMRQLERISRSQTIDAVVVATSQDITDDVLAQYLDNHEVEVRRGPLDDVLTRFIQCIEEFEPSNIVRLTADCPLIDPEVIDRVVIQHDSTGADYTSNTIERTFPRGLDVECVKSSVLVSLNQCPLSQSEREHVTQGIHLRSDKYVRASVENSENLSSHRWTVDYQEDFDFVKRVFQRFLPEKPEFVTRDIIDFLDLDPSQARWENDAPL